MHLNKTVARVLIGAAAALSLAAVAAPASAAGSFIDPLGRVQADCRGMTIDPNGKGLGVDPNGRCATHASARDDGSALDPNGRWSLSGFFARLFAWFA